MTEFLIAFTLLISVMAFVVPSALRNGQMQQVLRHDRLAMDELSNQLDRLTRLPLDEIGAELSQLQPSDLIQTSLRNPQLSGRLEASNQGQRLELEIRWESTGRQENPLRLATWIYTSKTTESSDEGDA